MNIEEIKKCYVKLLKSGSFDEGQDIINERELFKQRYSPQKLLEYKPEKLLYALFADNANKIESYNSLSRALEYDYSTDVWGIFSGVDYTKSPVTYSTKTIKKKGKIAGETQEETLPLCWRSGHQGEEISDTDAIKIAEECRDKIIKFNNLLQNGNLESFIEQIRKEKYYRFYHKYFYILYPQYLCSYHSKGCNYLNVKSELNLNDAPMAFESKFYNLTKELNCNMDDIRKTVEYILKGKNEEKSETVNNNAPICKNQILYGPPGTGKTHNTVIEAVKIIKPETIKTDEKGNVENYQQIKTEFNSLKEQGQIEFITFHQSYSYEEFVEGIRPEVNKEGQISYKVRDGIFKQICTNANNHPDKNFILIIDEINRGNISKIFGELITLIEEDKRKDAEHELSVTLPYSNEKFFVPNNLYIIGTMNTSDRSIASVDIALRRRFKFIEKMPKTDLVTNLQLLEDKTFRDVFEDLNNRISILIDRDHQIGHSYFMEDKIKNIDDLKDVWFNNILPLLNEYFYGNWEELNRVIPGFIKETDKVPSDFKDEDFKHCEFKTDFENENDFIDALCKNIKDKEKNDANGNS